MGYHRKIKNTRECKKEVGRCLEGEEPGIGRGKGPRRAGGPQDRRGSPGEHGAAPARRPFDTKLEGEAATNRTWVKLGSREGEKGTETWRASSKSKRGDLGLGWARRIEPNVGVGSALGEGTTRTASSEKATQVEKKKRQKQTGE